MQREYFRLPYTFLNSTTPYPLPVSQGANARGFLYVPMMMYAYNSCDNVVPQLSFRDINTVTSICQAADVFSGENVIQYPATTPALNFPLGTAGVEVFFDTTGALGSGNLSGYMYYTLIPLQLLL